MILMCMHRGTPSPSSGLAVSPRLWTGQLNTERVLNGVNESVNKGDSERD